MAHRKPLGTTCNIGPYDTDATVCRGDVIRTSAGTCYRVISVRRVGPGSKHFPAKLRHNLECVRIGPDEVEEDDVIHPLYWYPRERKTKQ